MKKTWGIGLVLCCVVIVSIASGQVKKGKTRLLLTEQLMEGLVQPNCKGLGEGLKETPADEKAWKELATKAALLNESSFVLMEDGRCPDGDWAGAAMTLRECSEILYDKIEARDADGAREAFQAMTKSCGACHKAHKK